MRARHSAAADIAGPSVHVNLESAAGMIGGGPDPADNGAAEFGAVRAAHDQRTHRVGAEIDA